MRVGNFLAEILDHWTGVEEGREDSKLLHMYSAHDTNVANLLNSLGVYNDIAPPYASGVFLELLQRKDGLVVRLAYRNDTTVPPHLLTLPGCDQLCPLHKFRSLTSHLVPEDWEQECGLKPKDVPNPSSAATQLQLLLAISCLLVLLVLIIGLLLIHITWTKRQQQNYQRL